MLRRVLVLSAGLAAVVLVAFSVGETVGKGLSESSGVRRTSGMSPKTTTSKKKKKKKIVATKKKKKVTKKKKKSEDMFDDDDDDESRYRRVDLYRPRAKKPAGPSVWQRASEMAKVAAEQAVAASKTATEKAKVLGAEAATRAQKASRFAKGWYSSEYEKFLLTATWPSDQRISPQLTKRLLESVARFPTRPVSLPEDDPYRVTLRKLWKKMIEKDWRTACKALYLFHALSRSSPTPKSRALSRTLKRMLQDVDQKSGRKYFNRRDLVVKKVDEEKARLVDAYAGFVLRRALLFAGKFDDVVPKKKKTDETCESETTTAADVKLAARRASQSLLVLDHALQFIEVARASYDKPASAHLVVVQCLDLVVADVHDAVALASASVQKLVTIVDDDIALSPSLTKDVQKSLEKFIDLRPRLTKASKAAVKTLRYFDLKASADLSGLNALSDDDLQDALTKWADRPANADDDDDDDDSFDDEDDDDDVEDFDDDDEDDDDD